jgi:myo-inositol-1(or 4)-monophosphatase
MRSVAERAALVGGEIVRAAGLRTRGAEVKGAGDYVTEVDRASERAIRDELAGSGIPVLGEEEGHPDEPDERMWVVDPLDGTANFLHGFPIVGVSIALVERGHPVVGVVHAPLLKQTWTAARGLGARRDGRPVRVSDRPPTRAIVGTGFPFRRKETTSRYLEVFRASFERFEDLRRPGAAALDLAWVAEGVFEGFFELGLSSWDVAAGGLLIQEAGGIVTDWDGGEGWLSGDILAGTPAVHAELIRLVRSSGRA